MGKGWDGVTLNFRRDTLGHILFDLFDDVGLQPNCFRLLVLSRLVRGGGA